MHSRSLWDGIENASASTAKNVIGATASILKWTGIFSGLTGLLGYFTLGGISDLGHDAFNWRKSSIGLGVSVGQQRAFDISFSRLLGSPGGFLGGINTAVSNIAAQGPLYALGVNPNGSTASVAISTLKALYGIAHRTPTNQLGQLESYYQLGNLGVSVEDLRRLQHMSPEHFHQLLGIYGKQQRALSLGGSSGLAWANFVTTMDLAKAKIETVFVHGLEPLAGPLANLATGFAHLLGVVMQKNGPVAKDITAIASWMDKFNGQIAKPQFITDVETFMNGVGDLAKVFSFLYRWTIKPVGTGIGDATAAIYNAFENFLHPGTTTGLHNPGNLKFAGQPYAVRGPGGFAKFVSNPAGIDALANQLELYNARGLDTVSSIVSTYAPASDHNDVPAYIKDVSKSLDVQPNQVLDLHSGRVLAALMRAIIKHEKGSYPGYYGEVGIAAMRAARNGVSLTINNNTGGSATTSVSGLGATR